MPTSAARIAGLALSLLTAGNALALGLGEVVGQAVLGQPLHIEIPLLGSGGNAPSPDCFRVRAPVTDIGGDFTLRNARVQVVGERGASRLIVTSGSLIREPLVAFAVAAGCGFELTKDYLLLTALPSEAPTPEIALPQQSPRPAAVPASEPSAAAAATPKAPTPSAATAKTLSAPVAAPRRAAPAAPRSDAPTPAASSDKILRIAADTTLEALSREKYPAQPKAREKFMRMMARANPNLAAEDAIIVAGTELQIPPKLPERRVGPYQGESKAAPPVAAPAAVATVAIPQRAAKTTNPAKDRLVLGAGHETNETKLLAEMERLTSLLMEQTKTQEALTESIAKLENNYGELQKRYSQLEERLIRIEAERQAEKQAPKPASFDFIELLFAVLAGGAIGGLVLHLQQRQQMRRDADAAPVPAALAEAMATSPEMPWVQPVAAAEVARAVAEEATAAAVEAAPAPLDMIQTSATPAPEAVAAELPAPVADDLDSFSLDFPLMPEEPEQEPVTQSATETPVPAEAASAGPIDSLFLDFPLVLATEAAGPEEPSSVAPATSVPTPGADHETLSLDFPEIVMAEAAKPEDAHVIEFTPATATEDAAAQGAVDLPKLP